jgi:hypothetical protein
MAKREEFAVETEVLWDKKSTPSGIGSEKITISVPEGKSGDGLLRAIKHLDRYIVEGPMQRQLPGINMGDYYMLEAPHGER